MERNISHGITLKIGAQTLESFVSLARTRTFSSEELAAFLTFTEDYAKAVKAHVANDDGYEFNRLRIAAETLKAKLTAPTPPAEDCGSEEGCRGCENHFCKRRWQD
jgi:hypothetical protein